MCIFEKELAVTILNQKLNFKLENYKIDLLPGNHIKKNALMNYMSTISLKKEI